MAQDQINQMRAEQIALEDRYSALRNEYEKLRNRLAARGDVESKNPPHPSALPLTYPPGESTLDLELNGPIDEQAWNLDANTESSAANAQRSPVPAISNSNSTSVLDRTTDATAIATVTPTQLQLVEGQTQLTPGTAPGSFVVRVVARPMTDSGQAANPIGTYSLRLINPRAAGSDAPIGYWNFPAEKIRGFVGANPALAANGVPLEVGFAFSGPSAPELVAEIEFHPVNGQKLTCRTFVGVAAGSNGDLKQWIDTLPVPQDASGLMQGSPSTNGPSATNSPTWSPIR
ncbi:MAG: hypothetical protein JNL67_12210 [Planctomycetaceae bacterium]|nr:hypothetical protein [Planctomycetaceae bacterium]